MTNTYKFLPIDSLIPHPKNRRIGDVDAIARSITANGVYKPVTVQSSTMHILSGNHTVQALRKCGIKSVDVCLVDCDDDTAYAILIADNRANDLASYDVEGLHADLMEYAASGKPLEGLLYSAQDIADMVTQQQIASEASLRGEVLDVISVTVGNPIQVVSHGEIYDIDSRHVLCCCDVFSQWHIWQPFLHEGAVFCPYPGPMIAMSLLAESDDLVMVHPDSFMCGHLLDRVIEVKGPGAVVMRKRAGAR